MPAPAPYQPIPNTFREALCNGKPQIDWWSALASPRAVAAPPAHQRG